MTAQEHTQEAASGGGTVFDVTTALESAFPDGDQRRFSIDLDPVWSSLRGIHGGYLAALAITAATEAMGGGNDREIRTVTTSFLRPALAGPANLRVEQIRRGRSITNLAVTLSQSSRDVAVSRITAAVRVEGGPSGREASAAWETIPDLGLPPIERCVAITPPPGIGHFDHGDAMLDPADLPFSHGPRARVAGYLRPREPRPIDAPWLGMALDWFPPAAFTRIDPPAGGVSIDYTVHLHRTLPGLGEHEWLRGLFYADVSTAGIALEKGVITDPAGRVLAESFHTRWTAGRAPSR